MARYFGTYGIRGTLDLLAPEFVSGMAAAFATYLGGGTVVIGTDTRTSRDMVKSAAVSGLLSAGCEVLDVGVAPSPTIEFLVKRLKAAGGIIVTASHNPPEWNALKFMGKDGIGITKERSERIEALFGEKKQARAAWDRIKPLTRYDGAIREHQEEILRHADAKAIAKRAPSLVLDCGNGVAGAFAPELFVRLGCKVVTLNAQADGFFPGRNSEPTKDNVSDLIASVTALHADAGIAWDGDGDRVIFVDEHGGYVWGDKSFALCAKMRMREKTGTVVTTVATGNVVKDAVEAGGGKLEYVVVGAPYIAEKMAELDSVLGGEEVGGVVWPELSWGKDGFMTAVKVVEEMCVSKRPLSALIASLPEYFNAKSKVACDGKVKQAALDAIRREFCAEQGAKAITIDGVRLDFPDGWVIARASGTEEYFRVFSEAKTQERADGLLATYKRRVEEILARS